MLFRRLSVFAAVSLAMLLTACATGPRPEAFIAEACMEAAVAESLAERSAQRQEQLASQLEEHQARLVELQRIRSDIVTGRMSDEELAQWDPGRLPWEAEPEPEPVEAPMEEPETADEIDVHEAPVDTTDAADLVDEVDGEPDMNGTEALQDEAEDVDSANGETTEVNDQIDEEMPAETDSDATPEPIEDSDDADAAGEQEQVPDEQNGEQNGTGGLIE